MVPHGFLNGVVDRDTVDLLTTFSRRYTCHDTPATNLLCIGIHQPDVELALFSRGALHKDTGLLIPVDHAATSTAFLTTRSIVSSISYPFSASIALPSASLVPASRTITFWGMSGRDDSFCHLIAFRDTAQEVYHDHLYRWNTADQPDRVHHPLAFGTAANIKEICCFATIELNEIERGHRKPGPVADHANRTVQLNIRETMFLCFAFAVGEVAVDRESLPARGRCHQR